MCYCMCGGLYVLLYVWWSVCVIACVMVCMCYCMCVDFVFVIKNVVRITSMYIFEFFLVQDFIF